MRFGFAQLRICHQRNGLALMLVVAVVALASMLGLVMLSTATLANRASANQGRMFSADYLAQSGVNLAMYYLQYPDRAPAAQINASGYWGGTAGDIAISSAVQGTVNVTVTRDASDSWTYEVVSTGTAGVQSDTALSRTTGARIYVRNEYQAHYAAAANYDFTAPAGFLFTGDVYGKGLLAFRTSVSGLQYGVSGTAHCGSKQNNTGFISTPGGGWDIMTNPLYGAPTSGDLNLYRTYTVRDITYNCDTIPSATTSLTGALGVVTKSSSASNPAGVWYRDGATGGLFTLNDNVTINGTLVIDGDLRINGAGIVITPNAGYPGLIVTGNVTIVQPTKSLTVNGTMYCGKQLLQTGAPGGTVSLYSKLTVNGSLLMGSTTLAPTGSPYLVTTTLTYDATKSKSPDLTSASQLRYASGISILRWGLP
jgi:hypothetical protein